MHQDFFDMLHKDHEEVEDILNQIESDSAARDRLERLNEEILPHMQAEEWAFYPKLIDLAESKKDAQEGIKEHNETKSHLKNLMRMSTTSGDWMSTFTELKRGIEHHVKNEESKIFDHARNLLSEDQIESIMKDFQKEKKRAKENLKVTMR